MPPNNPSARIRPGPNIFLRRGSGFICADPPNVETSPRPRRRLAYPAADSSDSDDGRLLFLSLSLKSPNYQSNSLSSHVLLGVPEEYSSLFPRPGDRPKCVAIVAQKKTKQEEIRNYGLSSAKVNCNVIFRMQHSSYLVFRCYNDRFPVGAFRPCIRVCLRGR